MKLENHTAGKRQISRLKKLEILSTPLKTHDFILYYTKLARLMKSCCVRAKQTLRHVACSVFTADSTSCRAQFEQTNCIIEF